MESRKILRVVGLRGSTLYRRRKMVIMSQKVRSEANVIVIRVSSTIRRLGTELQQAMFREKNYIRQSE